MSYLIYQHLGQPLAATRSRRTSSTSTCASAGDAGELLRDFANQADREVEGTRWSFCRDIGPAARRDDRLARRPRARPRASAAWSTPTSGAGSRSTPRGGVDHLLIGTSLPLFLAPGAALARGVERGGLRRRVGRARRAAGREAAPGRSISSTGRRSRTRSSACASCCARSARASAASRRRRSSCCRAMSITPTWPRSASRPGTGVRSRVWQAVCSPFRNPLDTKERRDDPRRLDARAPDARPRALASARACATPPVRWRSRTTSRGSTTRSRCSSSRAARHVPAREGAPARSDGRAARAGARLRTLRSNPTRDFTRT